MEIEIPFEPLRAKQARELRGLRRCEAAPLLMTTVAHLHQVEKGVVPASVQLVERMEAVYKMPLGFFGKPMSDSVREIATCPKRLNLHPHYDDFEEPGAGQNNVG